VKNLKPILVLSLLLVFAGSAAADTTMIGPNTYRVSSGVEFTLGNNGSSDYLFNWSDSSGSYSNVADPTLILVTGQTYTFRRLTTAHPFVITDSTLPVSGSAGSYSRTTTSSSVINSATLDPIADFTADPGPTTDAIVWTLEASDEGNYYYTCSVTFHAGMTGAIEVIQQGVPNEQTSLGQVKVQFGQ
jgi:plastocyanin